MNKLSLRIVCIFLWVMLHIKSCKRSNHGVCEKLIFVWENLILWQSKEVHRDLLWSVSLHSRLKSSSFICKLCFCYLLTSVTQWQSWNENWHLQSPKPVFHPLLNTAGLGHYLLHIDLLIPMFYRSFSPGLVSTLLYSASWIFKEKESFTACLLCWRSSQTAARIAWRTP